MPNGGAVKVKDWLETHKDDEYGSDQKWYSIAAIDHIDNGFAIYGQPKSERDVPGQTEHEWRWAYGIVRNEDTSCEIQLNSIPKGKVMLGVMVYVPAFVLSGVDEYERTGNVERVSLPTSPVTV